MVQRAERDAEADSAFAQELTALIPSMRAFARSLAGFSEIAGDDIAQDALLKAWRHRSSFKEGSNLKAWVFMILRNHFYSLKHRARKFQPLEPGEAERTLIAVDNQFTFVELEDVKRAMQQLSPAFRESLILVGAGGMTYEEAAEICGCPVGTIKSRLNRARKALLEALDETGDDPAGSSEIEPVEA